MAGEIAIHLATGLANIKAEIIFPDANYGWTGTQAVLRSAVAPADLQAGLVSLTESEYNTGDKAGLYVGDFPAGITTPGTFGVRVWQTETWPPSGDPLGVMTIDWNGSREAAFPPNLEKLGINASGHVSRVTLVDTCTANTDMRGTNNAYTGTPPSVEQIQSGLATLANQLTVLERLTAERAAFLDKLNMAGELAQVGSEMALTSTARGLIVSALEAEIVDDTTGEAVKQAIVDKIAADFPDLDDLTVAAIASATATATRDAILDRVLAGNHDTAGTAGKILQCLQAFALGLTTISDSAGDGVMDTVVFLAQDGVTPIATIRLDKDQPGKRVASTIH